MKSMIDRSKHENIHIHVMNPRDLHDLVSSYFRRFMNLVGTNIGLPWRNAAMNITSKLCYACRVRCYLDDTILVPLQLFNFFACAVTHSSGGFACVYIYAYVICYCA